jgi:beta-phosphoglucomutase family hydrolase
MGQKRQFKKNAFNAIIFDMDGVVTRTAKSHAAAWKKLFDDYLDELGKRKGIHYRPFSIEEDYRIYVDGKPRYAGVQSFIQSRGIDAPPWGNPGDPPGHETICSLGNKKNIIFNDLINREGVEVYESTIDLIHRLRSFGIHTAIVTSSKNCNTVLKAAGIERLFDAKVDGLDSERLNLAGKPDPDIFIHAARSMGVNPKRAVVVEDAIAGVQAGKRGGFGCVIGVDRASQGDALQENGADITVKDLSEISLEYDGREGVGGIYVRKINKDI